MKSLLALIVIAAFAAGGWFAYHEFVAAPEVRVCQRISALCGDSHDESRSCEANLAEVRESLGDKAMDQVANCVDRDTCVSIVACTTAALTKGAASEVFEGIKRGLSGE